MTKEKKKPRASLAPTSEKTPTALLDPDTSKKDYMSWRLSLADMEGPWGWRGLKPSDLDDLHDKLCGCETLTLGELMRQTGTTQIDTAAICPEAQKRLRSIEQDDLPSLWHLRLKGKWRVWGKIEGSIFYFLWWDPDHTVQPVAKKHT